jgi:hypothetical protein
VDEAIMSIPHRVSQYVDFNAGRVLMDPEAFLNAHPKPWSVDEKIDYFQCRVEVYQLAVAVEMAKQIGAAKPESVWRYGENALVSVITSYFEMVGKVLHPGSKKSRTSSIDFNYGFCDVYPEAVEPGVDGFDDQSVGEVAAIRNLMRNGIYHLGYPKLNLLLHTADTMPQDILVTPVYEKNEEGMAACIAYLVNPIKVTQTMVRHFDGFVLRLKDPKNSELRAKFEEFYDDFHDPD